MSTDANNVHCAAAQVPAITVNESSTLAEWQAHYLAIRRRVGYVRPPMRPVVIQGLAPKPKPSPPDAVPAVAYRGDRRIAGDYVRASCHHFGLNPRDIFVDNRRRVFARARHIAIWVVHKNLGRGISQLGRLMKRDHTSTLNSIRKIRSRLAYGDDALAADIAAIEAMMGIGAEVGK